MINDTDEKINDDLLQSYFKDSIPVHIVLKRILQNGKNSWLNGKLICKSTDNVWILQERELGEVRISISEITSMGVHRLEEKR
jgi:hypothetical protein